MIMGTLSFIFIVAAIIFIAISIFNNKEKSKIAIGLTLCATASLLYIFIERSIIIGFPALTGTFEALIFYSIAVLISATLYSLQKKFVFKQEIYLGLLVVAFILLCLASSPLTTKEAFNPVPALKSYWLLLHVSMSFIGESFFALSAIASIFWFLSKTKETKSKYDTIVYASILIGYPIFTAGALIFGAIWAKNAWGSYWSWDPKETWALITWLLYSLYLHIRIFLNKKNILIHVLSITAFLCTLFTFFGVNYLLVGLHSYK